MHGHLNICCFGYTLLQVSALLVVSHMIIILYHMTIILYHMIIILYYIIILLYHMIIKLCHIIIILYYMIILLYHMIILLYLILYHMILQFLKNLTLHRRNVATLLCQVIAPVVIISICGFLQVMGWGYNRK